MTMGGERRGEERPLPIDEDSEAVVNVVIMTSCVVAGCQDASEMLPSLA